LAGAILLVIAGGGTLVRATTDERRGLILSATVLFSIGLVWMILTVNSRLLAIRGHAIRCSFCGKSQGDVRKLVQATEACICDECVEICRNAITAET